MTFNTLIAGGGYKPGFYITNVKKKKKNSRHAASSEHVVYLHCCSPMPRTTRGRARSQKGSAPGRAVASDFMHHRQYFWHTQGTGRLHEDAKKGHT